MIYKWLLALWFLISCEAAVFAYTQATPPSAWRTTPKLSSDIYPTPQFRSTSSYTPMMHTIVYAPGCESPSYATRRSLGSVWDDDPDDEGAIGTVDTPVGEPLILLYFALLYWVFCILFRKSLAQFKKKQ